MDIFCDTNVLVAAMESAHPHHERARPVLESLVDGSHRGFAAAHSIVETYTALTRMPVHPKMHPLDAKRLIDANILPNFRFVESTQRHYLDALDRVTQLGLPGAKIYDALLLCIAESSGAERIYTFNTRDFLLLTSGDQRALIAAP